MINVLLRANYPTDTETLIEEVEVNADKAVISEDVKFLVLFANVENDEGSIVSIEEVGRFYTRDVIGYYID